jgi:hypothetical protein
MDYQQFVETLNPGVELVTKWNNICRRFVNLEEQFTALTLEAGVDPWGLSREHVAARIRYYLLKPGCHVKIYFLPYTHMTIIIDNQERLLDSRMKFTAEDQKFPCLVLDSVGLSKMDQILLKKNIDLGKDDTVMDHLHRILTLESSEAAKEIQRLSPEEFVVLSPWFLERLSSLRVRMSYCQREEIMKILSSRPERKYGWFDPNFELIESIVMDETKIIPGVTEVGIWQTQYATISGENNVLESRLPPPTSPRPFSLSRISPREPSTVTPLPSTMVRRTRR